MGQFLKENFKTILYKDKEVYKIIYINIKVIIKIVKYKEKVF